MTCLRPVPFALAFALALAPLAFAGPREDLAAAKGDAPKLYAVMNATPDVEIRSLAEFQFGVALRAKQLPVAAFVFLTAILRAGETHPSYLAAIEQLIQLQAELDDRSLIPNLLAKFQNASWDRLTPAARARANFLLAEIAFRKSQHDDAVARADAIDPKQPDYLAGQYLKALALGDARRPGGAKPLEAIAVLKKIVEAKDAAQARVQGLATLALGRMTYGLGQYADAVAWYARAREFPAHRAEAVFEGGFAQWQNDDVPGALASARASSNPEAVILESQLAYFGMKYPEARKALERLPAGKPGPNRRFDSVVGLVAQIEREKALLSSPAGWKGTPMALELISYLDQNGAMLIQIRDQLAKNRASELTRNDQMFQGMAEIMRFEIALAEGGSVDPAIASLKKIATEIADGTPMKAELLFHLAELHREKALQLGAQPAAAKAPLAEAQRLLDVVLKDYPTYGRLAEVRTIRDALAK